jgi:hypothetical protein
MPILVSTLRPSSMAHMLAPPQTPPAPDDLAALSAD